MEKTSTGVLLRGYIDRLTACAVDFSPTLFIAGGAIRRAICGHNIEEGDFDIYVTNNWQFEIPSSEYHWVKGEKSIKKEIGITTYDFVIDSLNVQFHYLHNKQMTIKDVLKSFDFTCCQFAYDGKDVRYIGTAVEDAKALKLRYTGSAGQFTPARAFRLMEMGFKANSKTLNDLQHLSAKAAIAVVRPEKLGRS
jgi:hypothetical protein